MGGAPAFFVHVLRRVQLKRVSAFGKGRGAAGITSTGASANLRRGLAAAGAAWFRARLKRGFTLLEVMVAGGIFALAFSGLYAASNHVMNLIRRAEDSAVAQRNCLARMDQIRSLAWARATSPTEIAALLAVPTGNATFDKEVVSVYQAPVPATVPAGTGPAAPTGSALLFTVTRTGNAPPVISPAGFNSAPLLDSLQLNFRVLTEWQRVNRTGRRELSTLFSKSASR